MTESCPFVYPALGEDNETFYKPRHFLRRFVGHRADPVSLCNDDDRLGVSALLKVGQFRSFKSRPLGVVYLVLFSGFSLGRVSRFLSLVR